MNYSVIDPLSNISKLFYFLENYCLQLYLIADSQITYYFLRFSSLNSVLSPSLKKFLLLCAKYKMRNDIAYGVT